MLVVRLPIAAPAPTRYSLIPRLAGFPSKGLASLFRFTESALTVGLLDDVSGGRFATSGLLAADTTANIEAARSSADNLNGAAGGLKLTGLRALSTAPIDITQPFTILIAATLPLPSDMVPTGVVAVGNVPASGFMAYAQILAAATLGTTFPLYAKPSVNGALDNSIANTALPLVATFNSLCFFVVKHKGGGAIVIEEHRGATVSSVQVSYDLTAIQGAAGAKSASQPVKIGGVYPGISSKSGIIYDALAVYTKATSADEDQAFFDASAALALTRNRS